MHGLYGVQVQVDSQKVCIESKEEVIDTSRRPGRVCPFIDTISWLMLCTCQINYMTQKIKKKKEGNTSSPSIKLFLLLFLPFALFLFIDTEGASTRVRDAYLILYAISHQYGEKARQERERRGHRLFQTET
jgi:L-asparagine transporter-like permease